MVKIKNIKIKLIIVLSRTNNTLKEIRDFYIERYGSIKGINFLTIHKAKGLQGKYV
jgi:superfamily I DNA/RNA helicase